MVAMIVKQNYQKSAHDLSFSQSASNVKKYSI